MSSDLHGKRYADSIVKLQAVCAVPRLSVSLLFVLSSRFLESQGDGTDNTAVHNLLQLQNPFSCLGWLPGDVSLDVFVLHPI